MASQPRSKTVRRSKTVTPSYVVIGTSAGGVTALSEIFKNLPGDLPAAVLVVMHIRAGGSLRWLADRLVGFGRLPVKVAEDGEAVRQGVAYLAPASTHLVLKGPYVRLDTGPPEQHSRPAIDALFRSAASTFGPRVIGVILTGMLRDGTLGLRAVRDAGGITIVQNPERAESGDMPRNAMRDLNVDYCVELSEIGPLLDLLVRRAGSLKRGVLETGLASAVRLMKDRVHLVMKLYAQSEGTPKTARFLKAEIEALDREIGVIQRLIQRERRKTKPGNVARARRR